ncbi:MAG: YfbK domain-containing protein, partial [Bacteroidota bacterium]
DVKVQVEFNPEQVEAYRLIGYENRVLNQEDFEDDDKDAGEIGADQNITALYEIIPKNTPQENQPTFTIDFRYKLPDQDSSIPMELPIFDEGHSFDEASDFMKFTSSIAAFSMLLTDSAYKEAANFTDIKRWLDSIALTDEHGYKAELKQLIEAAENM